MDLRQRRAAYAAKLERAASELVRRLSARSEVHRVILFGSYAAGRRDLLTDLDAIVVMDSQDDWVTRSAILHRDLPLGVDADLLVYTPQEFEALKGRGLLARALAEGKVVYARDAA
jgi:predicted nucleotidyltransferase